MNVEMTPLTPEEFFCGEEGGGKANWCPQIDTEKVGSPSVTRLVLCSVERNEDSGFIHLLASLTEVWWKSLLPPLVAVEAAPLARLLP